MMHRTPLNSLEITDLADVARALAQGAKGKSGRERTQIFDQLATYTRQLIPYAEQSAAATSSLQVSGEAFLTLGEGNYARQAVDALTATIKNPELPVVHIVQTAQHILNGIKELGPKATPPDSNEAKTERLLNSDSLFTVQDALERAKTYHLNEPEAQTIATLLDKADQVLAGYNFPVRRLPRSTPSVPKQS